MKKSYYSSQPKFNLTTVLLVALALGLNPVMGTSLMLKMIKKYAKEKTRGKEWENHYRNLATIKENTFKIILHRLKREGLVENPRFGFWKITLKGKKLADQILDKETAYREFKKKYSQKRDTIIIFDIPEENKQKREGLRAELVALGFEKLQLSVWIGGNPLPIQFMDYLKNHDIMDNVHIFSIQNGGTIGTVTKDSRAS